MACPRLLLVHASVVNGDATWSEQKPLERRLGAARAVLPGAGHSVQRLGEPFNAPPAAFVDRAEQGA